MAEPDLHDKMFYSKEKNNEENNYCFAHCIRNDFVRRSGQRRKYRATLELQVKRR
jgi:hypothetical protein